ncbi:hypothetical protein BOSEA31B_15155 [Hyphomicrobiales bacterium]|nr:hypothetical protein BOSEA31B_15155 [Hyphomicrobiales bacterium]CAH1701646.1 hypothetical protein BOSEA1005_21345 [Hyphomicrobiales bacterium]CAI0345812.1 hypothetical protein BO1005MUT1_450040 [Hyphomicrobiales bacterium]
MELSIKSSFQISVLLQFYYSSSFD